MSAFIEFSLSTIRDSLDALADSFVGFQPQFIESREDYVFIANRPETFRDRSQPVNRDAPLAKIGFEVADGTAQAARGNAHVMDAFRVVPIERTISQRAHPFHSRLQRLPNNFGGCVLAIQFGDLVCFCHAPGKEWHGRPARELTRKMRLPPSD